MFKIIEKCHRDKVLFLGCDISSRVTGYGLLGADGKGIDCGGIKTDTSPDVIDICNEIEEFFILRKLVFQIKDTRVGVFQRPDQ
mgnify:CR=1 FL=1